MKTTHWSADKLSLSQAHHSHIEEAAALIQAGELVAFPTETVYGLGGNALSDQCVEKIFQAKGRPSDNPLIVHIAETEELKQLAHSVPDYAVRLMEAFWPGPLTIVVPGKPGAVSKRVTAGLSTVAVRMPDHPAARALIRAAGVPLAAPSANRSGKPSPTTAQHVLQDLDGRIAGIVDAGATGVGLESTVVDCTGRAPVILRPGGVTQAEVEAVAGTVTGHTAAAKKEEAPKAPGMKYTHYAPEAPLFLMAGSPALLQSQVKKWQAEQKKVGVLTTEEHLASYEAEAVVSCGRRADLDTVARQLYTALRSFNEASVDVIVAEVFPEKGVGAAIMNRLEKAAGHKWM